MDYLIPIILAVVCGGILGAERGYAGKPAGLRTYILVTLAATVFTIISLKADVLRTGNYDPGRIVSQLIVGIGFIGGGVIVYQHKERQLHGITTATGLWISTAIGIAIGVELYVLALIVTGVAFMILALLPVIEEKIEKN